jgi:SHS2 domain-containing protein
MPYRYLEDIAIADAAFEAWGDNLEEMIRSAADATMNVMVRDLSAIRLRKHRHMQIKDSQIDMLLFQLLQELIYYKDAEQLLLRVQGVRLVQNESEWIAYAELAGESIDPERHDLVIDIKAVTLRQFDARQTEQGWTACVILDV